MHRKDIFITHRAFCDALTQESDKLSSALNYASENNPDCSISYSPPAADFLSTNSSISLSTEMMPTSAAFASSLPAVTDNNSDDIEGNITMLNNNINTRTHTNQFSSCMASSAHLSATALLQKAAQMGGSMSSPSSSLFSGLMMMGGSAAAKGKKKAEMFGQDVMMVSSASHGTTRDFLGLG